MPALRPAAALLALLALAACEPGAPAACPCPTAPPRAPPPSAVPTQPPPAEVAAIVAEISPARLRADVDRLVAFGTRHTLSDTTSPTRGIGAARRWLKQELESYAVDSRTADPGRTAELAMQVSFDAHTVPADGKRIPKDTEIVNVMAVLPGAMPDARNRRYYFVAHYDSRASDALDATSDAPGANDDGSGVAALLEIARVMSKHRFDATLVFVATAGEEQGLYGAKERAKAARADHEDVRAVLSDDIVGDPSAPPAPGAPPGPAVGPHPAAAAPEDRVRVFSEGVPEAPDALAELRRNSAESDSPSRELARFVWEVGRWEKLAVQPVLELRPDRFLRGGDHLAFNQVGFPAVRFTTVHETYTRQHQNVRRENGVAYGDEASFVDPDYLAGVARLNAAVLAHLADAPGAPGDVRIVVADLGYGTELRWSPSPEPDVAGYEIVWRDTTSAEWQRVRDVGKVETAKLPDVSKDDSFLGVRAYDARGYRSPVGFARAAKD